MMAAESDWQVKLRSVALPWRIPTLVEKSCELIHLGLCHAQKHIILRTYRNGCNFLEREI